MHISGRTALLLVCLSVAAITLSSCGTAATDTSQTGQPPAAAQPASSGQNNASQPTANIVATSIQAEPTLTSTAGPAAPAVQPSATPGSASAVETPTTGAQPAANVPQTGSAAIPTDTAQTFPDPAAFSWAKIVDGLNRPLYLASPNDGTGRLFVLEQPGVIRVVDQSALLPEPFLDIRSRVGSQGNEQGLLGLAFHPDYGKNGYFYINYTNKNGDTVIARYSVSKDNPNQADPNSEKVLLTQDQPFPNHNGGSMVFGPDGYLYMGLGDGGSGGDPHGNGQSVNTLLGKLLRIDVNGGDPYGIPKDNPFANGGGKPEIWAYGLRNPWRFSFDRLTGDIYIADVGQNQWEEVDYLPAGSPGGANFGWNLREAAHPFKGTPPAGQNLIDPINEYSHGNGCSVTGGYVYRGQALPEFRGIYIFADYCSGRIWGLMRGADGTWQSQQLYQNQMAISSFGEDTNGELYILDQNSGGVYRLQRK